MQINLAIAPWMIVASPLVTVFLVMVVVSIVMMFQNDGGGDAGMIGMMLALFIPAGVTVFFGIIYYFGVFMGNKFL